MVKCPISDGSGVETCGGWGEIDGIAVTKDVEGIRREDV